MKYYVTYNVYAWYTAVVEANNLEEAMKKAETEFSEADFGVAEDTGGEVMIVVDGNCNVAWERKEDE